MNKLGIVVGNGDMPLALIDTCIKQGITPYALLINGAADKDKYRHVQNKQEIAVGHVGKAIEFFKVNKIKNLVLIGGVDRPNFKSLKVDFQGGKLLAKILLNKVLGDDKLLRIIANFFEKAGFKILAAQDIMNDIINYRGVLTKIKPSNYIDIETGLHLAKKIGDLDIGQAIIMEKGRVIAVEAAEGTNKMIKRSNEFVKISAILAAPPTNS